MNDPDNRDVNGSSWARAARGEVVEFAAKIAETMREPFLVLDAELRVVFANPAFYGCFKVDEGETEGRLIYELGNNGWDIAELRRLLDDVLPNDERFADYRVEHRFEKIGRRVMMLNGRRLDHAQLILLAIEDVTDRDKAEQRLRASEATLASVLENLPVGVGLFDTEGRFTFKNPVLDGVLGDYLPSQDPVDGARWTIVTPSGQPVATRDYPGARALRGEATRSPVDFRLKGDDAERAIRVSAVPVREDGVVTGGVVVIEDVTEERRAEAEVRALSQKNREILESISDAFYAIDGDWRFTYVNSKAEELWGRSRQDLIGQDFWGEFPAAVGSPAYQAHLEAAETRRMVRLETVSPVLGRWIDITIYPAAEGLSVYFRDISDRKAAEAALREGEERYRAILESALDYAIFTMDADGLIDTWPAGAEAVFGWSAEEMVGQPVAKTFTPEDRASGAPGQELAQARENGWAPNVRWHLRKDGRRVFIEGSMRPMFDAGGQLHGFLKIGQDVTERRQWGDRQKVLLGELQHRTRNLMTVVGSMFEKTRQGAGSIDELAAVYQDRLGALARVQGLLSKLNEGARLSFEDLIRTELSAMGAIGTDGRSDKVVLDGPADVLLRSSTVQTLALALHELATNAAKYGALSQPDSRLSVTWRLLHGDDGQRLHIEWLESGVRMSDQAQAPWSSGFGRELIERALPYQLQAHTSYELGADGVRCMIEIPVSETLRTEDDAYGRR